VQEGLWWCGEAPQGMATPHHNPERSCPSSPSSLHRRHPPSSFSLITPYPLYRSHRPHPLSALSPLALVALIVQCMAGMGRDMRMHGRYALIPPHRSPSSPSLPSSLALVTPHRPHPPRAPHPPNRPHPPSPSSPLTTAG